MNLILREKIDNVKSLFKDVYFLLTLLVCVGLILFKLQDFYLPYFSDELWVYGPSVRKMGAGIPSMLPSSMALEDHWAHPMFFFFLGGVWCALFGASVLSTHVFAAVLSITLVIVIYGFGKRIFNRQIGFYSALIFASQSIFLGQFLLVLPEVLLTIFTLASIYFYWKKRYVLYLFFSMLLVLTKESGVFVVLSIGLWELIKDFLYREEKIKPLLYLKKYLMIGLPLFALGIHLLLLKATYGWFVAPIRLEHFEFSWNAYRERIMSSAHYVFIGQGRRAIIMALFAGAVFFHKRFPVWLRVVVFLVAFSMLKVFFKYWKLPDVIVMTSIPVLFLFLLKFFFWDTYKADKDKGGVISIFSILITLYLLFSSAQFDSLRYLLCIIPAYIIMGLYFAQKTLWLKTAVLPMLAVVAISCSAFYIVNDSNYGDDTNNYSNDCVIRAEAVHFIEDNFRETKLVRAPFLFGHALKNSLSGYLMGNEFVNVKAVMPYKGGDDLYVFCNMEPSEFYEDVSGNEALQLLKRFEKGPVWIELYTRAN